MNETENYHLVRGTILHDRYRIEEVLGMGGFGITYSVIDEKLQQKVAIKEYLQGETATRVPGTKEVIIYDGEAGEQFRAGREKFIEESEKLANLRSEQEVVHIFDYFEENNTAYIVMELLIGETLRERMNRVHRIPVQEAIQILIPVLNGLEKVHAQGLLHRDIAPDNIFLLSSGEVKLFDFGASRYAVTQKSRSLTVQVKSGYTPVEQYQSHGNQGTWTDVYAAAAVFYHMVTGEIPPDSMERMTADTLVPLSKKAVGVRESLSNAVMNALNVFPENRTPTAEMFRNEICAEEVKRRAEEKKKEDIGKMPLWQKCAVAGAIAIALGGAAYVASGAGIRDIARFSNPASSAVRVPNFVNIDLSAAEAMAKDTGIRINVVSKKYSNEILRNRIIEQNVGSGEEVPAEGTVDVVVSAGIQPTNVPDVTGIPKDDALSALGAADLIASFSEEYSYFKPGIVMGQSLEAGSMVDTGSEISVTLSGGYQDVSLKGQGTVGDFTGRFLDEAGQQAQQDHYYIERSGLEYSDTVPRGAVIRQEPAANATIDYYDVVRLVVSDGRERTKVPSVELTEQSAARQLLEDAGLTVEITEISSESVAKGLVMVQDPVADTELEKGSVVHLTVSGGTLANVEATEQRQAAQRQAAQQQREQAEQRRSRDRAEPARAARLGRDARKLPHERREQPHEADARKLPPV